MSRPLKKWELFLITGCIDTLGALAWYFSDSDSMDNFFNSPNPVAGIGRGLLGLSAIMVTAAGVYVAPTLWKTCKKRLSPSSSKQTTPKDTTPQNGEANKPLLKANHQNTFFQSAKEKIAQRDARDSDDRRAKILVVPAKQKPSSKQGNWKYQAIPGQRERDTDDSPPVHTKKLTPKNKEGYPKASSTSQLIYTETSRNDSISQNFASLLPSPNKQAQNLKPTIIDFTEYHLSYPEMLLTEKDLTDIYFTQHQELQPFIAELNTILSKLNLLRDKSAETNAIVSYAVDRASIATDIQQKQKQLKQFIAEKTRTLNASLSDSELALLTCAELLRSQYEFHLAWLRDPLKAASDYYKTILLATENAAQNPDDAVREDEQQTATRLFKNFTQWKDFYWPILDANLKEKIGREKVKKISVPEALIINDKSRFDFDTHNCDQLSIEGMYSFVSPMFDSTPTHNETKTDTEEPTKPNFMRSPLRAQEQTKVLQTLVSNPNEIEGYPSNAQLIATTSPFMGQNVNSAVHVIDIPKTPQLHL